MIGLLEGILLGLGAAVPIGPVNVEIARRTLAGGFPAGVSLGCGAVTVDVTYAALTGLGFAAIVDRPGLKLPLQIGGTILLGYLAVSCMLGAARARRQAAGETQVSTVSLRRGYITGLLMTLLNPMTLAFWLLAVPAAGARSGESSLWMVCLGVFIGTISWVLSFTTTLAFLRRFQQRWWMMAADLAGGLILAGFALSSAFAAVRDIGIIR